MNSGSHPRGCGLAAITLALATAASGQTVHVSRMWHNHQPLYWPEWNTNGAQTGRVEYAWDSITLKPGRSYPGSTAQHPENNLGDIFGLDDRRAHAVPRTRRHAATSASALRVPSAIVAGPAETETRMISRPRQRPCVG